MDRGAWQATVHRVAKSQTKLEQLSTHIHIKIHIRQEDDCLRSTLLYFACQIALYLIYHLLLYVG